MKFSGAHIVCVQLLVLFPLAAIVALPAGNAVASAKSLSVELSPDTQNAILEDIDETVRPKRSGSGGFDLFAGLKNQLASIVSKASASLASGSSGSSAGGSSGHDPHQVDVAHFDTHALKRSILNTLFQAVKAITGGLTALNGQLIKGSGYAISAGGQLVAKSGDAVSNVGKKIALSADLVEPHSVKYPTAGGDGGSSGGGSAAGIHATITKLISGSSASSSGSSSGHKEVEHTGHVEAYGTFDGAAGVAAGHYAGPSSTGAAYLPFDHPTSPAQGYHANAYGSTGHGEGK